MKLGNVLVDKIICILYDNDKNKKRTFWDQARRWKCPHVDFIVPKSNDVLQAHLEVLRECKRKNLKNVVILEDGAIFMQPMQLKIIPQGWGVVHLGGNVLEVFEHTNENYKHARIGNCFAYMVNQRSIGTLIKILSKDTTCPIDDIFAETVSTELKCYITTPPILVLRHNQLIKDLEDTPEKLDTVPMEVSAKGIATFKLPQIPEADLPSVSLIIIAKNPVMAMMALRGFYKTKYPRNKLQLIFLDYCRGGCKSVPKNDPRIKHVDCSLHFATEISQGQLYNTAIGHADHDYILHMSEMAYYTPEHVTARITALLSNTNKQCIGCTRVGYFDIKCNRSFYIEPEDINGHKSVLLLPSLAYTKKFWQDSPFLENITGNISINFIRKRYDQVITMPSEPIMIGFEYNVAQDYPNADHNLVLDLDEETQEFLNCLKNMWQQPTND